MNVNINTTGVEQVRAMLQRIGPALTGQALAETVVKVEDYIRAEAGKHLKTGALNSSIFKRRNADGSWEIGHDLRRAPHAVFVMFGTKAHLIKPIDGGTYSSYKDANGKTVRKGIAKGGRGRTTLRWAGGGAFHFAKAVHHPGNKPDDWLKRAAALAPQIFASAVQAHVNQLNRT